MNLNSDLREMILRKNWQLLAGPFCSALLALQSYCPLITSCYRYKAFIDYRFYKWKIQSNEYTPSPPWSGMCGCDYDHMIAVNFPALFFFLTRVEYKARLYFALTVILMTNFLAWAWFDFHHHFFKYARATQGWVLRLVWM